MKIAIIGSAGRKEDADKFNLKKYIKMQEAVEFLIQKYITTEKHELVSGGAAGADQIAISLYYKSFTLGTKVSLTLHLPCNFNLKEEKFNEKNGDYFFPGNIANYYHKKFSEKIGKSSLAQIKWALEHGAKSEVTFGFKERNTKVAQSDALIAMTFGEGAKVKDGGTADTVRKYLANSGKLGYHIDLNTMEIHDSIQVY